MKQRIPLFAREVASSRTAAWEWLSRAGRWLSLLAAGIALAVLVIALLTDRAHEETQARLRLQLATEARAHSLALHLGALSRELDRLGLQSEIDLLDENLEPERTLLRLTHGQSALFGVGVALLDAEGRVAWAEPQEFLEGQRFDSARWFRLARRHRRVELAPVRPEREDALLFVISPVVRRGAFAGALVGGIDLADDGRLASSAGFSEIASVLSTRDGTVVFPGRPPVWADEEDWRRHVGESRTDGRIDHVELDGVRTVVASIAVPSTNLVLSSLASAEALYAPARARLLARLGGGLGLVLLPLGTLLFLHRRSLQRYRRLEEAAVRSERLSDLGAAANVIAHEVKNSLNGVRLGLDLLLQKRGLPDRVIEGMRTEIARLTEFATELLLFARGIEPSHVSADLAEIARRAAEAARPIAEDRSVELLSELADTLPVRGDPALLQIVISNLLSNAIDAASSTDAERPEVRLALRSTGGGMAKLTVEDEGHGIPESIRRTLFDPFVTAKPSGIGIGLAISHRIAELHGGNLDVSETGPSGTTFSLLLPMETSSR